MLKKLIAASLIATTMFTAIPAPKANAGLLMGYVGVRLMGDAEFFGVGAGFGLIAIGGLGAGAALIATGNPWAVGGGSVLVLLDESASHSEAKLADLLSARYPFIDNAGITSALASQVLKRYSAIQDEEGHGFVTLSSEEIRPLLANADLSDEEIELVVNDLK